MVRIAGYGTAEEYEVIRRHALEYQPDVVVLMFVANDPFDTSPYLVDIEPYIPRFILDGQGELQQLPQTTWTFPWWKREITQTALYRYFGAQKQVWARIRSRGAHPVVGGLPLREDVGSYRNLPPIEGLAAMSMEQRQRKSWQLIEKLLEAMRDECRRRGARLAIVYRGSRARAVYPGDPSDARTRWAEQSYPTMRATGRRGSPGLSSDFGRAAEMVRARAGVYGSPPPPARYNRMR